jgi:hypothetical protein
MNVRVSRFICEQNLFFYVTLVTSNCVISDMHVHAPCIEIKSEQNKTTRSVTTWGASFARGTPDLVKINLLSTRYKQNVQICFVALYCSFPALTITKSQHSHQQNAQYCSSDIYITSFYSMQRYTVCFLRCCFDMIPWWRSFGARNMLEYSKWYCNINI